MNHKSTGDKKKQAINGKFAKSTTPVKKKEESSSDDEKEEVVQRPAKKAKGATGTAVMNGDKTKAAKTAKPKESANSDDEDTKSKGKKRKQQDVAEEEAEASGNPPLSKFRITNQTKEKLIAAGITELFPVGAHSQRKSC